MNKILETLNLTSKDEGVPPKEPTEQELKELRDRYEKADQSQVLSFYDELNIAEKASLYERLSSIDPNYINEITQKALHPPESAKEGDTKLEPLPETATASILDSKGEEIESWYQSGLDLVAGGQVAVVLMAGGQGTRLGSSAPKGCFNIGLPSQKSLFEIQAQRIRKVQQLAEKKSGKKNIVIPWYVMTSGPTRGPTENFFEEHGYFGLQKDAVLIFEQGVLPCISNEGKILLESKSKVIFHHNRHRQSLPLIFSRWQWPLMATVASTKLFLLPMCGRTCENEAFSIFTLIASTTVLSKWLILSSWVSLPPRMLTSPPKSSENEVRRNQWA